MSLQTLYWRSGQLGVALLAGLAAAAALSQQLPEFGVRSASHADYDRLVLEFDQPAHAEWIELEAGGLEIRLQARPRRAARFPLGLAGSRLGRVRVEPSAEGGRVVAQPRGPVRVFLLEDPPRVVVDAGNRGWSAPRVPNTVALSPRRERPIEVAEVEPPLPEPPPLVAPPPPLPPAPAPEPAEVEPPPTPPRQPDAQIADPPLQITWLAFLLIALALIAALFLVVVPLLRALRQPPESVEAFDEPEGSPPTDIIPAERILDSGPEVVPADQITPAELSIAGDRLEILEKRLDDEVRARMQVEERVLHLQEEQKLMRDRLNRITRRR